MTEHSPTIENATAAGQPASSADASNAAATVYQNPILFRLRETRASSATVNDLIRQMAVVICENTECLALWLAQRDDEEANWQLHAISDENASAVADVVGKGLLNVIETARSRRTVCSMELESNYSIVGAVVEADSSPLQMSIVGVFSAEGQSSTRQQWMLLMAVQTIGQWFQQRSLIQSQSGPVSYTHLTLPTKA